MLAWAWGAHEGALRADLQQFYGVSLDGVGSACSVRHAAALAANLPLESRLARLSMSDEQRELEPWTLDVRLAARAVNALDALVWLQSGAKKSRKPKPVEPPEERRRKQRASGGVALPGSVLVRKLDELHERAARRAGADREDRG